VPGLPEIALRAVRYERPALLTASASRRVSGLFQPTGVAVGPGGAVYVSNYGYNTATDSHSGEILKITGLS
jgi:hypothetical protein